MFCLIYNILGCDISGQNILLFKSLKGEKKTLVEFPKDNVHQFYVNPFVQTYYFSLQNVFSLT